MYQRRIKYNILSVFCQFSALEILSALVFFTWNCPTEIYTPFWYTQSIFCYHSSWLSAAATSSTTTAAPTAVSSMSSAKRILLTFWYFYWIFTYLLLFWLIQLMLNISFNFLIPCLAFYHILPSCSLSLSLCLFPFIFIYLLIKKKNYHNCNIQSNNTPKSKKLTQNVIFIWF